MATTKHRDRSIGANDMLVVRRYLESRRIICLRAIESLNAGIKVADVPGVVNHIQYYRHALGWTCHCLSTLSVRVLQRLKE